MCIYVVKSKKKILFSSWKTNKNQQSNYYMSNYLQLCKDNDSAIQE